MSTKTPAQGRNARGPGGKKAERYLQPSLLMALKRKPAYGYELIRTIARFGFLQGPAPPGMIYRHLRDLEENGLVVSEWLTDGSGPAKRIYHLTPEGAEVLDYWIAYMAGLAEKLNNFVAMYATQQGDESD